MISPSPNTPGGGPGQGNFGWMGGQGAGPGQPGPGQPGQGTPFGFEFNEGVSEYRRINGRPEIIRETKYVRDPITGNYNLEVYEDWVEDGKGGRVLVADYVGMSWDGHAMTEATRFECFNPYEDHKPLLPCRINKDGFIPPTYPEVFYYRLCLCTKCDKKNNNQIFWRTLFGWLGYQPEVY
jgi:hypothetical protein